MLEILIYGAVSSAIYAMLAVGFTLIFGVARILNLAHGSFYALGAYGAYFFTSRAASCRCFLAALLAVAVVAVFGVVVERVLVRPMRRSQLAVLMITLAVALVVEQALFLTFGSEYRNVPCVRRARSSRFGGVDVGGQRLLALGVSVCADRRAVAVHPAHPARLGDPGRLAGPGSRAVHGHPERPDLLHRDGHLGGAGGAGRRTGRRPFSRCSRRCGCCRSSRRSRS